MSSQEMQELSGSESEVSMDELQLMGLNTVGNICDELSSFKERMGDNDPSICYYTNNKECVGMAASCAQNFVDLMTELT